MIAPRAVKSSILSTKPILLFGNSAKIAYVNNPKAACTFAQNLLFYANHGYGYMTPISIHWSVYAFWKFGGSATMDNPDAIHALEALSPSIFTFVRDPLKRFISGFASKLLSFDDHEFNAFRDDITCRGSIDISANCNKKKSVLQFAEWVYQYKGEPYLMDPHFRPQVNNIFVDGNPNYNHWKIDNVIKIEDSVRMNDFVNQHGRGINPDKTIYNSTNIVYEDFYSSRLAEIIFDVYTHDYDKLGYKKEFRPR